VLFCYLYGGKLHDIVNWSHSSRHMPKLGHI